MINFQIADELKQLCPETTLGLIQAQVRVQRDCPELWMQIREVVEATKHLTLEEASQLPGLSESREAYRTLGKDPTRYRLASEALLRRVIKGKGLYQINNVVDINNLLSIQSYFAIGTYDLAQLEPPVVFTIGKADEPYAGIGRGTLNIENLPVFKDQQGPFGSPTSDSERSMIRETTQQIVMNIISFSGKERLPETMQLAHNLLTQFANATNIEMAIVE